MCTGAPSQAPKKRPRLHECSHCVAMALHGLRHPRDTRRHAYAHLLPALYNVPHTHLLPVKPPSPHPSHGSSTPRPLPSHSRRTSGRSAFSSPLPEPHRSLTLPTAPHTPPCLSPRPPPPACQPHLHTSRHLDHPLQVAPGAHQVCAHHALLARAVHDGAVRAVGQGGCACSGNTCMHASMRRLMLKLGL